MGDRSAAADWVRALARTADIAPSGTRTLAAIVDERAALDPTRPALVGEDEALSYSDLAGLMNRCARWALAHGLAPGDRVALMMANAPAYAAIWLGLSRVGIVTALINTHLRGTGLAHCLAAAGARHVIGDAAGIGAVAGPGDPAGDRQLWMYGASGDHGSVATPLDPVLAALCPDPLAEGEAPPVTLRDPALLIFTSGTTGLPKAAHVSHYRIVMWSEWFAGIMNATPDDTLYDCLPMYHSIGGVVAIGAMLAAGGTIVVRRTFSATRFWADVAASGATILQYIGELCRFLVNAPGDDAAPAHRLRLACGNGLREEVWRAFVARFAIPQVIEFYAATEGSFSLFNLEGRPGAIGRIPRFMAHRSPVAIVRFDIETERPLRDAGGFCQRCDVGDPGEAIGMIAANAADLATRFEGYTNAAETERKVLRDVFAPGDAWFRTGDLMKRDAQGFFYFVDRIGDTFRWKGENVSTAEVADALAAAPGVLEVAVYGVEVPGVEGRAGMAALVLDPMVRASDASLAGTLAGLHLHLAAHLPRYARPVFLRVCASLDQTGTFKLQKVDLARAGFDPGVVADALYVDTGAWFQPIDDATYAAIVSRAMRL